MSIINRKHLDLGLRKVEFLDAKPFPFIVLDDFLDADFFSCIKESFRDVSDPNEGRYFDSTVEEKKWISLNSTLPGAVRKIVDALNSEEWVENLRKMTGIDSLVTTHHGNTKLANYHVMEPGGVLGPHVDHSYEPISGIPHVLNNIVYLTENWSDAAGGGTIFYDKRGKNAISKVSYRENRAVLFLHTPYSFHGVERIAKESGLKRRTIYVDYYSESTQPYQGMKLDFDSTWFRHATTFRLNSYRDYLNLKNSNYMKTSLLYHVNRLRTKLSSL